jgi:hypothetical protein
VTKIEEQAQVLEDAFLEAGHEVQREKRRGEIYFKVLMPTKEGPGAVELALLIISKSGIRLAREWRIGFVVDELKKMRLAPMLKSTAVFISRDSLMALASRLSHRVNGTSPKLLSHGHRWSDPNESAKFTTYTPAAGIRIVCLVSLFEDGSWTLGIFDSEELGSSIASWNYASEDVDGDDVIDEMSEDIAQTWGEIEDRAMREEEGE